MRIKTVLFLCVYSLSAFGSECKLKAVLESGEEIETSVGTDDALECEKLAQGVGQSLFSNIADDDDTITEVSLSYEPEF